MRRIFETSPSRLSHRNDATKLNDELSTYISADYDSDQNSSGLMKSDSMENGTCGVVFWNTSCQIVS